MRKNAALTCLIVCVLKRIYGAILLKSLSSDTYSVYILFQHDTVIINDPFNIQTCAHGDWRC